MSARAEPSTPKKCFGKENKNSSNELKTPTRGNKRLTSDQNLKAECSPPKQEKILSSPSQLIQRIQISPKSEDGNCLSAAIKALHASQPNKLPARDDKIELIKSVLDECLVERKSSTLYISGQPGTGKTACLNYLMSLPDVKEGFKIVYLNCTGMKSASSAFKRIADELKLNIKGSGEKCLKDSIIHHLKSPHKMILMVLDEMDQLESKGQSILYTIFEWPSLPKADMVLIGIANALDLTDRVLPRLQSRLELKPTLIHFAPYTRQEIIEIVAARLEEVEASEVLDSTALQMLASKVSAVTGDIRRALDTARRAIELVQSNGKDKVTLKEILAVVSNIYSTAATLEKSEETDENFTLQQKIFICTLLLFKQNLKIKDISVGRLHDIYKKICDKRNIIPLDLSEFLSVGELVESRGIVKLQGKSKNRLSKVLLLWDESEVSNALKDKQLLSTVLCDVSCL